ncbi:MAG: ATP-dependent sacrificial sulfur transferase LarE [Gemmatimonadetes bacterium]|nr:ATP-dependent sacrificial sulfur transferase LarE [Gemmatimonadota bacterium]
MTPPPTSAATPDPTAQEREARLLAWCRAEGSLLVGFSGGVDSAYLACVALDALGPGKVLAVIGRSASYPEAQWTRARAVADQFGIPVLEVDTDELADPRYAANPSNRCYFCKSELWSRLGPIADARGLARIVDGTNADDVGGHRPGMRAAQERAVASPLADLGFTKAEIRALSAARGIPTWDQPSSPCLASRLPTGMAVTPERLRAVESAEASLRALGIEGNLRVRHFGELARVELDPGELTYWGEDARRARLETAVRAAGFARVEIDPRGYRSGALSVLAGSSTAGE